MPMRTIEEIERDMREVEKRYAQLQAEYRRALAALTEREREQ